MHEELELKLNSLKNKYTDEDSQSLVREWETHAKKAVMTARLAENDAMKLIIEKYKQEVDKINRQLFGNKELFNSEEGMYLGRLLHERKKWCEEFLGIFSIAKTTIENMTKTVDDKLIN